MSANANRIAFARKLTALAFAPASQVPDPERVRCILAELLAGNFTAAFQRGVLKIFLRNIAREIAKGEARVEYAGAAPEVALLERLEAQFSQKAGRPIRAICTQNAELIAGLRVRLGDDVYESSARAVLDNLLKTR